MAKLLRIQESELRFPFVIFKRSSCTLRLTNATDRSVAFKVKTTNPKQYCVSPSRGIVMPGDTCTVTVTMGARKEASPDLKCNDKFLIQSFVAPDGTNTANAISELFNKEDGKIVEESKLRVVYVPVDIPLPVSQGIEEANSPLLVSQKTKPVNPHSPVSQGPKEVNPLMPVSVNFKQVNPHSPVSQGPKEVNPLMPVSVNSKQVNSHSPVPQKFRKGCFFKASVVHNNGEAPVHKNENRTFGCFCQCLVSI